MKNLKKKLYEKIYDEVSGPSVWSVCQIVFLKVEEKVNGQIRGRVNWETLNSLHEMMNMQHKEIDGQS